MDDRLVADLDAARADFIEALGAVDAGLVTVPGVMEDWSVRDMVVHLAAWAEHASRALELASTGRGAEFAYSTDDTDAMNARILTDARATAPVDALAREETAFEALRSGVVALDPALLGVRLGNGDRVEEVIRYDGPDHYAEHASHLRSWFAEDDDDDDDEDGD